MGSTAASAQMTLAARQAKEAERRSSPAQTQWQQQQQKKSVDPTHDAWSGLDSLGSVGLGAGTPAMKQQVQEDDWGLGDFGPTATMTKTTTTTASRNTGSTATSRTNAASPLSKPAVSQTKNVGALWDLDDFANPSASTSSSNGRPSDAAVDDDWGLSDFGSQSQTKKAPQRPTQDFDSPDRDFNFGAREDFEEPVPRRPRGKGLLDLEDDEDLGGHSSSRRQGLLDSEDEHGGGDDVLGDLSRPVEEVRKRTEPVRYLQTLFYRFLILSFFCYRQPHHAGPLHVPIPRRLHLISSVRSLKWGSLSVKHDVRLRVLRLGWMYKRRLISC